MLALVLDGTPRLVFDHPRPRRSAGEARVRMRLAGICDTDLQLARGYMGFRGVPGHEFVGEVIECDRSEWQGRRVVADINAGCGHCDDCTLRDGHHCPRRSVVGILDRDGALAEELVVPERCLVAVPDHVPDEHAVFAEPLAAALHVLDAVETSRSDHAVVLGDGKLGLLIALALTTAGLPVTLVGHHRSKLAIARAAGIEVFLEHEVRGKLEGVPLVIEATGSEHGLGLALQLVRPRGTVVLKTTVAGTVAVDLSTVVVNEITLVGSRCGDLRRAMEWLARGAIDPTCLISARYPLTRADEALNRAATRGVLKVLVQSVSEQ